MEEALAAARKIAEKSMLATMAVKEAVNRSYETTLQRGCFSSAACSIRCLPPRIRKKACRPLSKKESHSFGIVRGGRFCMMARR